MAAVAGTLTTFDSIGNREDLSNLIYNISPTETPFMSMIAGRGKVAATYSEWQTDSLASASTSNAFAEGEDATYATAAPTTRVGNRTQISKKTILVSGTEEIVDKAGRDSEYEYQAAKRMAELKRDMEAIVTGNQASSAGSRSVARKLGSLEAWYTTNTARGAGGNASGGFSGGDVVAAGDATAGAQRTISETLLKTACQQAWTQGGQPDYVMVGPVNKQFISKFTGIATLYRDTMGKKSGISILGAADIYVSDFGEVKIIPNRFQRERTAHVLDSNYWQVGYLRPFKEEKLAKTGDGIKGHVIVEYTLKSLNEAASAVIADLTTTLTT
jgi:hypothetical protein